MNKRIISVGEIQQSVTYNPENGQIHNISTGKLAGSRSSKSNYVSVHIRGIKMRGHVVAWIMENGEYPNECIDHINGIRSDNRISNLRSITHSENMKNKVRYKNNTTGVAGVYFDKDRGKYRARLGFGKNVIHVGRFDNLIEAKGAIALARKKHGYLR